MLLRYLVFAERKLCFECKTKTAHIVLCDKVNKINVLRKAKLCLAATCVTKIAKLIMQNIETIT